MRAYLRMRNDRSPALFISIHRERLTYDGLNQLLERKAKTAKLDQKPTLHSFRRAFAINMLRAGVDIFALQWLMGHADLQVLRRYLAQNDQDNQLAHMQGGPVDNNLWLILVSEKPRGQNKLSWFMNKVTKGSG